MAWVIAFVFSILTIRTHCFFVFFDSFGILGLLNFITEKDLDILNKVIPGKFNQIFKQDKKIMLLQWMLKHKNYRKLASVVIN